MLQLYASGINFFLNELNQNNNKEWFDIHRTEHKKLDLEFQNFVQTCIDDISKFDPLLKYLIPKDCVFRINRDVRFSHNKTPYKTTKSAVFTPGGKKNMNFQPGYYFELDYNGILMIGGGLYMPETAQLFKLRQEISDNPAELTKILEDSKFKTYFKGISGTQVKTTPHGFSKDNEAINLLKYKSYIVGYQFNISKYSYSKLKYEIVNIFEILNPFILYLRAKS